jgi:hypothetical protein
MVYQTYPQLTMHPDWEADLINLPRNKKGNKERKRWAAVKEVRVPYVSKARRAALEESMQACMRSGEIGVVHGMTFHTSPYKESLWRINKELLRFNKRKKQRRQRAGRR